MASSEVLRLSGLLGWLADEWHTEGCMLGGWGMGRGRVVMWTAGVVVGGHGVLWRCGLWGAGSVSSARSFGACDALPMSWCCAWRGVCSQFGSFVVVRTQFDSKLPSGCIPGEALPLSLPPPWPAMVVCTASCRGSLSLVYSCAPFARPDSFQRALRCSSDACVYR